MISLKISDVLRVVMGLSITIANFIAVVILLKCKKMAFQIRIFTIQLATTDVITGLLVTVVGLHISDFSVVTCRTSYHMHILISNMTCLTITAMSCDRFLALCFPLRYRYTVTARKIRNVVIVLWIISVALSLLPLRHILNKTTFETCHYVVIFGDDFKQHATVWSFGIILNIVFYVNISWSLFCRQDDLESARSTGGTVHMNQQKRILRKILVITTVFVLTYTPVNVVVIILAIDNGNNNDYMTAYFITMLIWLTNSILNPCVYVWQYPECREKLLGVCLFCRREAPQTQVQVPGQNITNNDNAEVNTQEPVSFPVEFTTDTRL